MERKDQNQKQFREDPDLPNAGDESVETEDNDNDNDSEEQEQEQR